MEFADAGGLTDAPAVVPRSSGFEPVDIVRPAGLLDRPDHGGPLSLTYGRFGDILVELFLDVFRPGRDAPPDAVASRSSDTVEPKDVLLGVVTWSSRRRSARRSARRRSRRLPPIGGLRRSSGQLRGESIAPI